MDNLILIGEGGRCRIRSVVERSDSAQNNVLKFSIIGTGKDLQYLTAFGGSALVTIGQITTPYSKCIAFDDAAAREDFLAIVSPRSSVSKHVSIGKGSIK